MPVCINYEAVNGLDIQSRVNMKGVSTRNYKANNEACCSDAMVQRWSIALSVHDYTVQYRSAKQIQHDEYISGQSCWWSEINSDTCRIANNCEKYHKSRNQRSKLSPWTASSEAWRKIHPDYCGPFLGQYYALVIIDSVSEWPEVYHNFNKF
ncbi:hypothetical protein MS3_00003414 [Schistosoma haematobium]|uniref:Uncharacterized protein n=1 Tax=Schistosoma haematobium TaxID=6185 RepID=A0A922LPY6_SCHHA|nr:hypothetical protein MS3_00003414 [Schistosoma haematobium]KAH9590935.1 hypothetical protein MS3_00003414 [Schistosoma haematobium]